MLEVPYIAGTKSAISVALIVDNGISTLKFRRVRMIISRMLRFPAVAIMITIGVTT